MNWIRIAVGIMDDPSILELSEVVGVSVPTTTGHVVGVLAKLPTHARTGDLSAVSDRAIEQWARWGGKQGKFAAAFRAYLCDTQGVVEAWEKHNGAALREADKARERMQAKRAEWKASHERSANVPRTDDERSHVRNGTGRNGTTTTTTTVPAAVASRPVAQFPAFSKTQCDAAYAVWLSDVGAVAYARFRKAFGPLFAIPEAERPSKLPRNGELVPTIRLYCAAVSGSPEARFRSVEKCAGSLTQLADALRSSDSSDAALTAAQWVLGSAPRLPLKGAA